MFKRICVMFLINCVLTMDLFPEMLYEKLITDEGLDENKNEVQDEYCISKFDLESNKCKTCVSSKRNEEYQCQELKNPHNNCLMYDKSENCLICQFNFFLNKNKECEKIEGNCAYQEIVNNATICMMCKPGLMIEKGSCSESNKCTIKNCNSCRLKKNSLVEEECHVCKEGFMKKDNLCYEETEKLKNCWVVNIETDNCSTCRVGYFLKNDGTCQKTTKYDMDLFGFNFLFEIKVLLLLTLFFQ